MLYENTQRRVYNKRFSKTTEQNRILSVGLPQAAQSWQKNKGLLYLTSKKNPWIQPVTIPLALSLSISSLTACSMAPCLLW